MLRKNKLLVVVVVVVMVFGLMGGLAVAEEPCERYGQGYWKQWLADKDNDNAFTVHANDVLLAKLKKPARGNADQILTYQFIAAALNVEINKCKMPVAVDDAYNAAKSHLHDSERKAMRSVILGWKDILEYWNENEHAKLLSVEYEGTCDKFGSHVGDTLTFTFSNNVFEDGTLRAYFESADSLGANVPVWSVNGNILTITAESVFSNPRPRVGDYVTAIEGLVDFIGLPVVVNDVLVEGEVCDPIALTSVEYWGICNNFGSNEDDILILTFSGDIAFEGSQRIYFANALSIGTAVPVWEIDNNILTIRASSIFNNPRPKVGDYVTALDGIVNALCRCPVIVEPDIEVTAITYHYHWEPGFPYGATDQVSAVAIVNNCGMDVWWYSDGTLIAEGWYYDQYSIKEVAYWFSGNPTNWNEPVKYLFEEYFTGVTTAWYSRTALDVSNVPTPLERSILLTLP